MSEAGEVVIETGKGKPNVADLITDRLGIDFKNPPKEIPANFINRIKHRGLFGNLKENYKGVYLQEEHVYLYRENKNPYNELRLRAHEAMHGLFHEVNPDHIEMIKTLTNTASNPTIKIGFGKLLMEGKISLESYDSVMGMISNSDNVVEIARMTREGVSVWGEFEVASPHIPTFEEHIDDVERELDALQEDMLPHRPLIYIRGHAFVAGVVEQLKRHGFSKGDALVRLMLKPPIINDHIKGGPIEYAEKNLI